MDRGPLNYDGIIKHRICVKNVQEVERMGILVPPLFIEANSHSYILFLLARQWRINR